MNVTRINEFQARAEQGTSLREFLIPYLNHAHDPVVGGLRVVPTASKPRWPNKIRGHWGLG